MLPLTAPTPTEIAAASCITRVDLVPRDPETTAFKQRARMHQARWRESHAHPMGTHPIVGASTRPLGSRLPLAYAQETLANFVDPRVAEAVLQRLHPDNRQTHELLDAKRLYADLLSSMPMCFNLFGTLTSPAAATRAVRTWWPDVPGTVAEVIFEWSPARADPLYLGNRTSFDVAFILDLGNGKQGVLGVETKYHEHPTRVGIKPANVPRYLEVSHRSALFGAVDLAALMRDEASQVWLDHLLALSMLQHPSGNWQWARFVTVYADANPSWARVTSRYRSLLADASTFGTSTLDELLGCDVLDEAVREALVERYRCWG